MNNSKRALIFLVLLGAFSMYLNHKTSGNQKNIALFYPASHPAIENIERGVKAIILENQNNDFGIKVYNANGNNALLHAQAEEIIAGDYAVAIPVGATCTQVLVEVARKKHNKLPIVFTAVADPFSLGIINKDSKSEAHITGVTLRDVIPEQFDELMRIKPSTKTVLLVYDPTQKCGALKQASKEIEQILAGYGVVLKTVEVFASNEINQKVSGSLQGVDVILVLKDHTVVAAIDALVSLCNKNGITLYASDLDSGAKGAALSYGVQDKQLGVEAAEKALLILSGRIPSEIPITQIKGQKLCVNMSAASKQGLDTIDNLSDQEVI